MPGKPSPQPISNAVKPGGQVERKTALASMRTAGQMSVQ